MPTLRLITLTDATAIGESSVVNTSNKIRLGNTGITIIEGQVAYSVPSDARFKYNVRENVPGLFLYHAIGPVTYHFDTVKFDAHLRKKGKWFFWKKKCPLKGRKMVHTGFWPKKLKRFDNELGYDFDGLHVPNPSNPNDNYSVVFTRNLLCLWLNRFRN